ncbi:YncE family protein [Bacillaceae bacterium C204]|uniref:YncE family protein n=1 Tax=Neobacillus sp. 204 TaxID=3383351 RepID=UPI003978DB97
MRFYNKWTVSVIDTEKNKVIKTIQVGEEPVEIDLTPDGKLAVVTNFDDDTISVIDTKKNKVIKTLPAGDSPVSIAILSRFDEEGK